MPDKTSLGTRMKESYENRTKQFLTRAQCPNVKILTLIWKSGN